ncbi:MAG: hypothetical protein KAT05_05125 [Spirochaetes bacterium]|nr:hypothetical protein [Spirochaetota bacterium]
MNNKILCRVFDILKLDPPNMDGFSNRLKYQKIIYLLQASGLSLGYGFNWYVRGPYSPILTNDLYEIDRSTTLYNDSKDMTFKGHDNIVSKLETFNSVLEENINDSIYLEVLASLHYINKVSFSGNGDLDTLAIRLLEAKPSLKSVDNINKIIENAYNILSKFN